MIRSQSSHQISDATTPLLRAPPFPGAAMTQAGSPPKVAEPLLTDASIDRLFAAIREARVGGSFWAKPAASTGRGVIVSVRSITEMAAAHISLNDTDRRDALWLLPTALIGDPAILSLVPLRSVIFGEVDPWSLLDENSRLVAHGDNEWIALAHIAGCSVRLISNGIYGDLNADAVESRRRIASVVLLARYDDPFTGRNADVLDVITYLGFWRRITEANRGIVAACGIAWWKRREIARFLWSPNLPLRFFRSERRALAYASKHRGAVAIWPSRISAAMVDAAGVMKIPLVRIEDGFVRSVGLGSNMVPPSSITVDRLGIHYDPGHTSDLERLLAITHFSPTLIARAQDLRARIITGGISKYGGGDTHAFPPRQPGRRLVLVPGQVEDDMSVRLGGGGLASNLELLRRTRVLEPDAEIWFRPHPDVDAGHRKGAVADADALGQANRIVRGGGMAGLLDLVDAVHVLTSLTGFEALLRGLDVTCHGTPFYAGWGLTRDLLPASERRGRPLTLDQLVAGVLILYPRYLDPVTALPCEPEMLLERMVAGEAVNRLGWVTGLRRLQGRLWRAGR